MVSLETQSTVAGLVAPSPCLVAQRWHVFIAGYSGYSTIPGCDGLIIDYFDHKQSFDTEHEAAGLVERINSAAELLDLGETLVGVAVCGVLDEIDFLTELDVRL